MNTNKNHPTLAIYHLNAKGTGCAVKFQLNPATVEQDGHIAATFAPQSSVADYKANPPKFPQFDQEHAIAVNLDFSDLCKMLQVFRGECESIDDGRGLYHRSARATTRIVLRHLVEPVYGYSLEVHELPNGGTERMVHILFSPSEALGLCEAFAGSLSLIAFGVPNVCADRSANDLMTMIARA